MPSRPVNPPIGKSAKPSPPPPRVPQRPKAAKAGPGQGGESSFQKSSEPPPKQGSVNQPALFDMREFSFLQGIAEREMQSLTDAVSTLSDTMETLSTKVDQLADVVAKLHEYLERKEKERLYDE